MLTEGSRSVYGNYGAQTLTLMAGALFPSGTIPQPPPPRQRRRHLPPPRHLPPARHLSRPSDTVTDGAGTDRAAADTGESLTRPAVGSAGNDRANWFGVVPRAGPPTADSRRHARR